MAKKKATEDQFNWLKTNDISGVALEGNPLSKLAAVMPTVDPELVQRRLHGSNV